MDPLDALLLDPLYLDALYKEYQRDPSSVSSDFASLFRQLDREETANRDRRPSYVTNRGALPEGLPNSSVTPGIQIYDLVHTFRQYGHLNADLDPLNRNDRHHPSLDLGQFGFSTDDLGSVVQCAGFHGLASGTLQEHIDVLLETYCGPIGVEYMDVLENKQRDWLQEKMEPGRNHPRLTADKEKVLLRELIEADTFEESLHSMYPGSKRFSLEGGTTLITLLNTLVTEAAADRVEQIVFGMAHRGRLNVLAHVLKKPLEYILAEFEGRPLAADVQGYGDVKYHAGFSSDYVDATDHSVHLSLAFNPSHLETVNPVVEGIVRSKQRRLNDHLRRRVIPVLLHGDAAFAGQGVVMETLTLAGLAGYNTGGTVHIIVNNQVGFTADPDECRSTRYASDIAKSVRAPVFHVNADHPEAVSLTAQIAFGYRQTFGGDVVIDLVCFRRHGHNEMDDASFTQPVMARLIGKHPSVSKIYAEKLVKDDVVSDDEVKGMIDDVKGAMAAARNTARAMPEQFDQRLGGSWQGLKSAGRDWSAKTSVDPGTIDEIASALLRVPEGFTWHSRLHRLMTKRSETITSGQPMDWGAAEALAIGSLLLEGTHVRLSGQDSGRGTFGHRHSIYTDFENGTRYLPLDNIRDGQARLEVHNSPLSEYAVLGFEYGYSSSDPWSLVIWEAQFGDFANGAQVIIDQLIAGGEYKWGRMCGLVMLLPHGYEGQGPEHSSARLERFLGLCAENNMQVVNLTTPAQLFHCLRRQIHRKFRKPLVVMSPKSLLRHPRAVSTREELSSGTFRPVLEDSLEDKRLVKRALLCSGKVYYSLLAGREERKRDDVAIVRIEQLYPYPLRDTRRVLASYPNLESVVWVQEEPRNMGAWRNLRHRFDASPPKGVPLVFTGRDSRAVPATGGYDVHQLEESELVEAAFAKEIQNRAIKREEINKTTRKNSRSVA